jgi:L-alanine-DL-glutamate epimerase-like enolase superfamily enzyme
MKIDSVDFYYLAMPNIRDIGDGSQDALLVRIRAGGLVGWGECEASPVVSIANWICPTSHSACKSPRQAVLGETLDSPRDIERIHQHIRTTGLDIAQTDHTLSGIDIALWDLLGKSRGQPVYELLGFKNAGPKTPYASQLFGDTPQETFEKARRSCSQGYRAVKFGWGPFGRSTPQKDRDQVAAAREAMGKQCALMVDAGTVWLEDLDEASKRIEMLNEFDVLWLEEPFVSGALNSYQKLAAKSGKVKLAAGEGSHNIHMAEHLIDHGGVKFIQIDTGRIGGITAAKIVADYAASRCVTYVNHTFTTHLALSASLQPFAGHQDSHWCEYPVEASELATALTRGKLELDADHLVRVPNRPGLGIEPNSETIRKYLIHVEIVVGNQVLYRTPETNDL